MRTALLASVTEPLPRLPLVVPLPTFTVPESTASVVNVLVPPKVTVPGPAIVTGKLPLMFPFNINESPLLLVVTATAPSRATGTLIEWLPLLTVMAAAAAPPSSVKLPVPVRLYVIPLVLKIKPPTFSLAVKFTLPLPLAEPKLAVCPVALGTMPPAQFPASAQRLVPLLFVQAIVGASPIVRMMADAVLLKL